MIERQGLGRLFTGHDERNRDYPIRPLLTARGITKPRSYTWRCDVHLDQGPLPACTGFAGADELAAKPVVVETGTGAALWYYHEAQKRDGIALPHDGSTVQALAAVLKDDGKWPEYRWAFGLDDLVLAVGYHGPAVLGINWYEGMDNPDAKGNIKVAGAVRGGHAILANGVNVRLREIRLHNSWGANWGINGECWISFDDLGRLLHESGEAVVPVRRAA